MYNDLQHRFLNRGLSSKLHEALEYPKAPVPRRLAHNSTFMVFGKLHQNIRVFNDYLDETAPKYAKHRGLSDIKEAREELSAKFVGRWKNGAPLTSFPKKEQAAQFIAELGKAKVEYERSGTAAAKDSYATLLVQLSGFNFDDDLDGSRCPVGSHIRRINPRGALEFGRHGAFNTPGALVNRRRILRRGLPYGRVEDAGSDGGEHGVIFMAVNASIKRQFEFVQQQWVNYGNDFRLANDKDPLLGNHEPEKGGGRMLIEGDPSKGTPAFFCTNMKRFVETRGGDYFFIPSLTALRLIAEGAVDPT